MNPQTLTINALSHCDWKDCPEELVKAANGKCVMLVREDDNVDPHAVRVHFHARVAGYVCRDDAARARCLMGNETSVLARVVETVEEPYYKLRVEVEANEGATTTIDDDLNRIYDQWEYTGPLLTSSYKQKQLEGAVEYLGHVLKGHLEWDEEAEEYYEMFLNYHRKDFSDEMFHFRHNLAKFLEGNNRLTAQARRMEMELHEMTKHEQKEQLMSLIEELPHTAEFAEMLNRHGDIDGEKIIQQMRAFPDNMVSLLCNDRMQFCKRLYYVHPHREVLRRLFSGIGMLMFFKSNGYVEKYNSVQQSLPEPGGNVVYNFGPMTMKGGDTYIGQAQDVVGDGGQKNTFIKE